MLQTDEVDDDYFTPIQGTSLANIFGHTAKMEENETLKYTPPKQQNTVQISDDATPPQCDFVCAVIGHEWVNGTYMNKGKLGLAIAKIPKQDIHSIILYDASKTTLSCTSISSQLEIRVNSNHILYYDNLKKYWCIYATEDEIGKIVELLKSFNVSVKENTSKEDCPSTISAEHCPVTVIFDKNIKEVGSDTDSSTNRKTKASILNRMAMMGHSVLPPQTSATGKTSDSSDTNDSHIQTKAVRHKPLKNTSKRNHTEQKHILQSEPQKVIETQQRIIVHNRDQNLDQHSIYTNMGGVLIPTQNTGLLHKNNNEIDYLMAEQRISNSEFRINFNRLTEKIDNMAEKINDIQCKEHNITSNSFQTEILQKLLLEYENKIKTYEEYFKSRGIKEVLLSQRDLENTSYTDKEIEIMKNKIAELEQIINDRDNEIAKCQIEIQMLLGQINQNLNTEKSNADLLQRITELEQTLSDKNEDLAQISKRYENPQGKSESSDGEKLKIIMNETYSIIASNFNNSESYKGDAIKKTIAGVIRKVTFNSLSTS